MPYAYIALALTVFAAGFGLSYQLDKAEIQGLQMAIERGNVEADMVMQAARHRVDQADKQAAQANQQLEASHAQSIETINNYRGQLDRRLHERSTSRANTLPGCASAGTSETETGGTDIPERAIADMAFRADQVAAYAGACWQFVSNNCGIASDSSIEKH